MGSKSSSTSRSGHVRPKRIERAMSQTYVQWGGLNRLAKTIMLAAVNDIDGSKRSKNFVERLSGENTLSDLYCIN